MISRAFMIEVDDRIKTTFSDPVFARRHIGYFDAHLINWGKEVTRGWSFRFNNSSDVSFIENDA